MIVERRRHRRILTLRNFRRFILFMAILVTGLVVQSDLRQSASGDYGRLFGKQVSRQTEVKKVDVVREAPVVDQTSADPLLVAPAAREQYLGATTTVMPPVVTTTTQPSGNVAIVNGPNGVTIVRGGEPRGPLLSGGIFRQR